MATCEMVASEIQTVAGSLATVEECPECTARPWLRWGLLYTAMAVTGIRQSPGPGKWLCCSDHISQGGHDARVTGAHIHIL